MSELVYETSETKHWKNLFPNKTQLLGSHNLNEGEELIAEIVSVTVEKIKNQSGGDEEVAVINFNNAPPMVMNITNAKIVSSLYGDLYTGWIGQSVQIYATPIKAFGQVTNCLRIRGAIPETKQDLSKYQADLNACETMDELKKVFTAIPKHLKTSLAHLKDSMKDKINENS